jgi:hypothetical protein
MHDGGVKTYLYINDKFICSAEALYTSPNSTTISGNHGGSMIGITTCNAPVIPVKAGDWLYMIAEYDVKKHPQ